MLQRYQRIWIVRIIFLLALSLAGGLVLLFGIREVERFDAFCGTCHMNDHRLNLKQSLAKEAETLSAFHHIKKDVRCIDCHGYDSIMGRMETTLLATKSLLRYLTGAFEDPSRVTAPIRDENCIKCHPSNRSHPSGDDDFHGRYEHISLPVPCIDCHEGHKAGSPAHAYLVKSNVLKQCNECHPDIGQ